MNYLSISLESISLHNIVRRDDRANFLGKEIKAYTDSKSFQKATVEDFFPDPLLQAVVTLKVEVNPEVYERHLGFITKDGFAIQLCNTNGYNGLTVMDLYETWLKKFEEPELSFGRGIEIRVSKELVEKLKVPFMRIATKVVAVEAFAKGIAPKVKEFSAFQEKNEGSFVQHQDKDDYIFAIDGKCIEIVADYMVEITDAFLQKAAAVMVIMDFKGLEAITKRFTKAIDKRVRALK